MVSSHGKIEAVLTDCTSSLLNALVIVDNKKKKSQFIFKLKYASSVIALVVTDVHKTMSVSVLFNLLSVVLQNLRP